MKKVIDFIKNGAWENDEAQMREKKWGWLFRPFKIIMYTAKGLGEHNIGITSAALSFYTLTALVPIAAMVFGIMKGFGLEQNLIEFLNDQGAQNSDAVKEFTDIAIRKLNQTRGGIVASAGFIFLVWAVMKVFGNIERVFNNIWEIKKQRSFSRKFTDYMAVIFVAPLLLAISYSMIVYIRNSVSTFTTPWLGDLLFSAISALAIWFLFTFVYYVLPNTKVRLKGALIAGILAGTGFQIFQWAYVLFQGYMTSYNAVYGTLAAIPLFFIWLQISWQILLFGAELSYAYQHVEKFDMEREGKHMSHHEKRKLMIATMMTVIRHFTKENKPVSAEELAEELNMPLRTVRDVVFDLENAGMIVAVRDDSNEKVNKYIPARDVNTITAWDVIDSVESHPHSNLEFKGNSELETVDNMMESAGKSNLESVLNVPLVDIMAESDAARKHGGRRPEKH